MNVLIKTGASFFTFLVTTLIRRDRQIVLCAGWFGRRFADNSRYMYLFLNQHKNELGLKKIIWITKNNQIYKELKNNGLNVYKKHSILSIYYHLRAQYFIYDQFLEDFYTSLTLNGKCINLWHGMPIKKFGQLNGLNWDFKNSYLLTCSQYGDKTLGKCFNISPKNFIHGMYPRNHYLLNKIPFLLNIENMYIQKLLTMKKEGRKILFYLPTFRKNTKLLFLGEKESNRLTEFFSFLKEQNYLFLTKIHFRGVEKHHDAVELNSQHLLNLPPEVDIYPFLKLCDLLLTDYSSVLFDFLYLDKDIICFPYDLENYRNNDQGLLLDYNSLPAFQVKNLDELQNLLNNLSVKKDTQNMKKKRKEWLSLCFENKTMKDTISAIFTQTSSL